MKATRIYHLTFDTDETIMAASLAKTNELIMLMRSGNVIRYNLDNQKGRHLFSVKSSFTYTDGGFDVTAKSSIYTMDEIVVLVNDYKRHGFVHYPDKYHSLHLWREDYHADISQYPIALYKNDDSVPHLIFGAAWNHLQIMNLDTRQVLTAAKSLIEENAEERHIEASKHYDEPNKLPWPRPYDYFFGGLLLSPDKKYFLSTGWGWGSCDCYNIYNTERFISSNRISALLVGAWEHENRGACWIDNETIAVAYDPVAEGDENSDSNTPGEIHFYKIRENNREIINRIQIPDKDIVKSRIYFNKSLNVFVALKPQGEVSAITLHGHIAFTDEHLKAAEYSVETGCFLVVASKTISVYEITE